jgi:hypothetical protein
MVIYNSTATIMDINCGCKFKHRKAFFNIFICENLSKEAVFWDYMP